MYIYIYIRVGELVKACTMLRNRNVKSPLVSLSSNPSLVCDSHVVWVRSNTAQTKLRIASCIVACGCLPRNHGGGGARRVEQCCTACAPT